MIRGVGILLLTLLQESSYENSSIRVLIHVSNYEQQYLAAWIYSLSFTILQSTSTCSIRTPSHLPFVHPKGMSC